MAFTQKIIGAVKRLRGPKAAARPRPSGPPETVGAPKPGAPGGVKSATAPKR